jgi:hypothetical protein
MRTRSIPLLLLLFLLGVGCNANNSRWSEPTYLQSEDAVESDGPKVADSSGTSGKQVDAKASVPPKPPTTTAQVTTTPLPTPTTRVPISTAKQSECGPGFMEDRNRLNNLLAVSNTDAPGWYGSSESEMMEWFKERVLIVRDFNVATKIWGRCFPQGTPQVYRDLQAAESRWAFLEGISILAQMKCYTREMWPLDCMEELHDDTLEEGPAWEAWAALGDVWTAQYYARKYQEEK